MDLSKVGHVPADIVVLEYMSNRENVTYENVSVVLGEKYAKKLLRLQKYSEINGVQTSPGAVKRYTITQEGINNLGLYKEANPGLAKHLESLF